MLIKLFVDHGTAITTVFHTIVFSCHLVCFTIFVLVFNTRDFVAFDIRVAFFSSNIRTTAVLTIKTDVTYTVFAGHRYSVFTIFIGNSYLAVCTIRCIRACDGYAILTIFGNRYRFSFKIFAHFHVNRRVACCRILFDESLDIFTAIVGISCFTFALYDHCRTQFISFHTAYISIKFKACCSLIRQSLFQLVFCCSTTRYNIPWIPSLIIKTSNIVACITRIRTISLFTHCYVPCFHSIRSGNRSNIKIFL